MNDRVCSVAPNGAGNSSLSNLKVSHRRIPSFLNLLKAPPLRVVLLGAPGSGKGTIATRLQSRWRWKTPHVSTGEILRKEKELGTSLGKAAAEYSRRGILAPDEIVNPIVLEWLSSSASARGFIFDGFPRNRSQARELQGRLEEQNLELDAVIELVVPDDVLDRRMINRGRPEEKDPEVRKTRIEQFKQETAPVTEFYRSIGNVIAVDGVGSPAVVTRRVMKAARLRKWYHPLMF